MDIDFTPSQLAVRDRARAFAAREVAPRAAEIDRTGEFPTGLVRAAGATDLLAVAVPSEWGGAGAGTVAYALAIEELSRASGTLGVIASVCNSLVCEPIARAAGAAQKREWLPALASGERLGAFALSEDDAGTDAASLQTVARADGDGFHLLGTKAWVANAPAADLFLVFAKTDPSAGARGITAFLVPAATPGIERGPVEETMGVRGLGCETVQFDCRVRAASVLGRPGEGFRLAMWALEGGRIAIAAQAVGLARAALDEAIAHANTRRTFGQTLGSYEAIQWMLADSATELDAARLLTYDAASRRDAGERCAVEAAMAKLYASEVAKRVADRAVQVLASRGYRAGAAVERIFRDARATTIYQGTSEVQRMIIAAGVLGGE